MRNVLKQTFSALLLGSVLAAPGARAQQWDVQIKPGAVQVPRGTMVIQNVDSVWTAAGQVLENVSILIRDGIIREIGPEVSVPKGATVIDGKGMNAIPGLVDEHSHTAMDRSTNEGTVAISAEVKVLDALDPSSFNIYRALSGGVTSALILHGSANPIGGQAAIIKMRWGMEDPEQLLVQGAPKIVKFALGENVTRKNFPSRGRPARFPQSREGVEALYTEAFTAAQEYKRQWDEYNANPKKFKFPPRRDLRMEALVDIMEGKIRVHAHSYRSDEIVMLMRVAERFGFKIDVFTHVLEGYKVADELREHGAGASTFSDWWAYKLEAYDAIPYNAAIMHDHGVLTSINSDIPWLQSFMVYEFNKPVKYGGVSKEEALRMLTAYPARQLHIDDKVGTLEVGKQADVVLLNGDPFNTYTRVEKTIVDGIVYYDRSRESETRKEPVRSIPPAKVVPASDEATSSTSPEPAPMRQQFIQATFRPAADVTALVGATVHTVSGPVIQDGVVLITDGKISAVGPRGQIQVPQGARQIDVSGKHVYPGMIDPMTQVGMIEIGQVAASRDDRELGQFNPHVSALWGIHPQSVEIPVTRANGITTVMSVPASGVVQGTGAVIKLAGDTPERMVIKDRAAMVVSFPSPKGKQWEDPKLEGDKLEKLVTLFQRATEFAARPSTIEDPAKSFSNSDVWGLNHAMLESMVPAVTGKMPVFFRTQRERDIKTLFLFLDKFPDVKAVIVGGDQAFRVADELAKRHIPVIVGSAGRPTMDRDDPITAGWENAGILARAGVKVAFTTQDYANVRNLPYHAAKAAAFGLPKEEALKGVTLAPAEILGLGDELGSVETGKRANLIVTDGDPLQILTHVEAVFIDGEQVPVESKHTKLWKEFKDRH